MTEHPGSGMMGLPVRLICIECLESIEVSLSGSTSEPSVCPHCGCYLDPFQQGIHSRVEFEIDSPLTLSMAEASTLRSESPSSSPMRQIGRFQVRQVLGEGGYGQVYRAFDPHLEREVALKVLKANRLGEKALERFYREARAAARLDHPNIVALHDAGRDEGRCWIAYQLVTGRTLSAVRDLTPPSVLDAVRIVRELALALDHAHGRGVFHRDLKPANIMIDDSGRPRLTDFGLARRDDIVSDLTVEGTVLGTPQYMSPEAAAGRAHEADARSDVYSLGVILYELLCGRRPCELPSGSPLWRSNHHLPTAPPRVLDRSIPVELDQICMKALAFNPADRYANAKLLSEALTRATEHYQPPGPKPQSPAGRSARTLRIIRPGWLALGATASMLAVAAASLLVQLRVEAPVANPLAANFQTSQASHTVLRPLPTDKSPEPAPIEQVPEPIEETASNELANPDHAREVVNELTPFPDLPVPTEAVIGNTDSKKYHVLGCSHLRNMKRQIVFKSEADALAHDYSPCEFTAHRRRAKPSK